MSANSFEGLYAVCGSFIGLSSITVGLRFYSRAKKSMSFGVDDYTALFGVITFIAAAACMIQVSILGGQGYSHGDNNTNYNAKEVIQLSIAFDFMQMNTLACAKISALFLYRRIFSVDRYPWFKYVFWGTLAIIAAWYVTWDVLSVEQCPKFSDYWTTTDFVGVCKLNPVWANGLAVTDLILDIWVMIIPLPFIWNLHATLTRKAAILGVFLLAFVGIGASIARVVFFFDFDAPGREVIYVGLLESGMTITVVSLPSIWWLFSSALPQKVDQSLHSLGTLCSGDSEAGNSRDQVKPEDPFYEPYRQVDLGHRNSSVVKSFYSSAGQASYTGDVEAMTYSRKDSDARSEMDPNVIGVEHRIEVKHS